MGTSGKVDDVTTSFLLVSIVEITFCKIIFIALVKTSLSNEKINIINMDVVTYEQFLPLFYSLNNDSCHCSPYGGF